MPEVSVDHYRHAKFFKHSGHGVDPVHAEHFLIKMERSAYQEAFRHIKPAGIRQLPERSPNTHGREITGFKKPDYAVVAVSFRKIADFIKFCSGQDRKAVEAAPEKTT